MVWVGSVYPVYPVYPLNPQLYHLSISLLFLSFHSRNLLASHVLRPFNNIFLFSTSNIQRNNINNHISRISKFVFVDFEKLIFFKFWPSIILSWGHVRSQIWARISSDSPCNAQFTMVPSKALPDQIWMRYSFFCLFFKLLIFIWGFSAKVTGAFLAFKKRRINYQNQMLIFHIFKNQIKVSRVLL